MFNKLESSQVSKMVDVKDGDILKYITPEYYGFRYFRVIRTTSENYDNGLYLREHCRDKEAGEVSGSPFDFNLDNSVNKLAFKVISRIADQKLKRIFGKVALAAVYDVDKLRDLLLELGI